MPHMNSLTLTRFYRVLVQLIWFRFQLWAFKNFCGRLKHYALGGRSQIALFTENAPLKHHTIFLGYFLDKKII